MTTVTPVSTCLREILPAPEAEERIEVRCFLPGGDVRQLWAASVDEVMAMARPLRGDADLFYGPALRTGERGKEEDVSRFQVVWADVDAKVFPGGKGDARAILDTCPLPPSLIVDSGNGYHPYWLLREPHDREDVPRARNVMRGIKEFFSRDLPRPLDAVHDLGRVLRLPGTFNRKGRVPLPVQLVELDPDRRYDLTDFLEAGLWREEQIIDGDLLVWPGEPVDAEEALCRAIRAGLPTWVVGALEEPARHVRQSESELDFAVAAQLGRHLSGAEIEAVWLASALGTREKVQQRPDYRERTIIRALSIARRERPPANEDAAVPRGGVPAASARRFLTARELAELTPVAVEWIAAPWVAKGAVTEITGKIKAAGKTTFVLHLARRVVDGDPFMGQPTTKTGIVYLTEQPDSSFLQALRRADLDDRDDFTILRWSDARRQTWTATMTAAVEECERRGAGLLVIDTLGQFAGMRGDSENNAGAALEAMQPVQEASQRGLAVIVVRHERKGGGDVADAGRGSSAFSGAADVVLSLRRGEGNVPSNRRVIQALSRFEETPETLVVELIEGEYVALGTETAVSVQQARQALHGALPTSPDGALTLDDLVERADLKRTTVQSALKEEVAAGAVHKEGSGKKGDPFRFWRAADTPALSAATQSP